MSALGQKRTLTRAQSTSALPPKADILSAIGMSGFLQPYLAGPMPQSGDPLRNGRIALRTIERHVDARSSAHLGS
jgi:hypothetical protein